MFGLVRMLALPEMGKVPELQPTCYLSAMVALR